MVVMVRQSWSRDELLLAFNLYCKTPFGRLHKNNADVIQLGERLGRTASAVAMKLVNFASLDPAHQRRKIAGLKNASQADRDIFAEFSTDWERLAFESEQAVERLADCAKTTAVAPEAPVVPGTPTEREQIVRVRLVQRFFRGAVLASYGYRCAVCRIAVPEMLNASHIIPWSVDVMRRAGPCNGLAMCAFHDRAFDRGLVAVDETMRVIVAKKVFIDDPPQLHKVALMQISGRRILLPDRFRPDEVALLFHRQNIFLDRLAETN